MVRSSVRSVARIMMALLADWSVSGVDRVPAKGPLLVVINHLGLLDAPLLVASCPRPLDGIVVDTMLDAPVVGPLLRWYGVIPVRRDSYDREVLVKARAVLDSGRALVVAPEAGVSESGALRQARDGVAYLAASTGAFLLPAAITGTEWVHGVWDQATRKLNFRGVDWLAFWRRDQPRLNLKLTFGNPFTLEVAGASWAEKRQELRLASQRLMGQLAALLPPQYRGVYADTPTPETNDGDA